MSAPINKETRFEGRLMSDMTDYIEMRTESQERADERAVAEKYSDPCDVMTAMADREMLFQKSLIDLFPEGVTNKYGRWKIVVEFTPVSPSEEVTK